VGAQHTRTHPVPVATPSLAKKPEKSADRGISRKEAMMAMRSNRRPSVPGKGGASRPGRAHRDDEQFSTSRGVCWGFRDVNEPQLRDCSCCAYTSLGASLAAAAAHHDGSALHNRAGSGPLTLNDTEHSLRYRIGTRREAGTYPATGAVGDRRPVVAALRRCGVVLRLRLRLASAPHTRISGGTVVSAR
jgi:hypothetical protein